MSSFIDKQTFDLAVAHLRLRKIEEKDSAPHASSNLLKQEQKDSEVPLDLLSMTLIQVFQEAFSRARGWVEKQMILDSKEFDPHTLDASSARLDQGYLARSDLAYAWLELASFPKANLREANLTGANLSGVDCSEANLIFANLSFAKQSNADNYMFVLLFEKK